MNYRDVLCGLLQDPLYGVEVGVHRGRTSEQLLSTFPNLKLWLVDPWGEWNSSLHPNREPEQEGFHQEMMRRTQRFVGRAVVVRKPSVEAVGDVPDDLDFAFIDAEHDYDNVRADLAAWWPKCNAIYCHDYGKEFWGVTQAVDEFGAEQGLDVNVAGGHIAWMTR
jgi:hypothetical protein